MLGGAGIGAGIAGGAGIDAGNGGGGGIAATEGALSSTKSEVVPAILLVLDLLKPKMLFNNVLFPALGFPNMANEKS